MEKCEHIFEIITNADSPVLGAGDCMVCGISTNDLRLIQEECPHVYLVTGNDAICKDCGHVIVNLSNLKKALLDDSIKLPSFNDPINPSHYKSSDAKCSKCSHPIECVDVTATMSFLAGNIIKYVWRYQHKDGVEGLKKAQWYLDYLIKKLENETS